MYMGGNFSLARRNTHNEPLSEPLRVLEAGGGRQQQFSRDEYTPYELSEAAVSSDSYHLFFWSLPLFC